MKEIILDTETTGISTKDGHRIVEIGCIELENLIPTKNKFHCYLNPERKVSEKALEVHGYTDEFLSKKKKFKEIVNEFLEFIKEKRLIIHNAEFDLSHLNNELKIIGKGILKNDNTTGKERRTGMLQFESLDEFSTNSRIRRYVRNGENIMKGICIGEYPKQMKI